MSWTEKERIEFVDAFERTYGNRLSLGDDMLPILHFIYSSGKSVQTRLLKTDELIKQVELQLSEVKLHAKAKYNFESGEAMKWQIGIALKYLIVGSVFLFSSWSAYFWLRSKYNYNKALNVLSAAPAIEQKLLLRVQRDQQGFKFIEFKKARGSLVENYTEFDLIDKETVRIYLGKEE